MNIRKVVIPAAGFGTRLAPLTQLMPKEMLPLGGKVVLQYVLEECDAAGLDTALVVINRRKTALFPVGEETPGEADPVTGVPKRSVYFANQEKQGGLAHAILHAEAFTGADPFAVALGDTLIHGGGDSLLGRMKAAHLEHGAAATIAAQFIPDDTLSRYGVFAPMDSDRVGAGRLRPKPGTTSVETARPGSPISEAHPGLDDVFRVREIVEKPPIAEAPSRYAVTARYVFSPDIYAAIRAVAQPEGGEIALTDAVTHLAKSGKTVLAVCLGPGQRRLDIGNPKSYAEAFQLLSESGGSKPA